MSETASRDREWLAALLYYIGHVKKARATWQ
jgi:hypothetical protein